MFVLGRRRVACSLNWISWQYLINDLTRKSDSAFGLISGLAFWQSAHQLVLTGCPPGMEHALCFPFTTAHTPHGYFPLYLMGPCMSVVLLGCPIELSVVTEVSCICVVQCGGNWPCGSRVLKMWLICLKNLSFSFHLILIKSLPISSGSHIEQCK